jgi:hypothetical protein
VIHSPTPIGGAGTVLFIGKGHAVGANIKANIKTANDGIRAALQANDLDLAQTLISRKVGWMVLVQQIKVVLPKPKASYAGS